MDEKYTKDLTAEQMQVCHLKGTEPPSSGRYNKHYEDGTYMCVACKTPLFSSETKFDSGSGWPAFSDVVEKGNVDLIEDDSHGMHRTEVVCRRCKSHLGHVFPDGPGPTHQRYCINSVALNFDKKA